MKKRNITLFTAIAAAAAFASSAQAALTNTSVLRSTDGGTTFTLTGQGADADSLDWGLGTFTTTGAGYHSPNGTLQFRNRAGQNHGYLASDVLSGGVGDFLAGAQYLATDDADKTTSNPFLAKYQFTFDQAGTFYILEDRRGGNLNAPGFTDTGVDINNRGLITNVWSQTVAANQVLITPTKGGSIEPLGYAFQADAVPEPATMSLLALGGLALLRRRRA
mgnify:CR=1 FL=1